MSEEQIVTEELNEKSLLQRGAEAVIEGLGMGLRWLSAEWIWINHGRPFREMNDVNHLYYQVCSKCEFFLNDGCTICRCRLVPNELSGLNKISMATTNCPLPEPKWISGITPPDDISPEIAATALRNARASLVEITEPENYTTDQSLMTVSEVSIPRQSRGL